MHLSENENFETCDFSSVIDFFVHRAIMILTQRTKPLIIQGNVLLQVEGLCLRPR